MASPLWCRNYPKNSHQSIGCQLSVVSCQLLVVSFLFPVPCSLFPISSVSFEEKVYLGIDENLFVPCVLNDGKLDGQFD
jgi:hypothetical protein